MGREGVGGIINKGCCYIFSENKNDISWYNVGRVISRPNKKRQARYLPIEKLGRAISFVKWLQIGLKNLAKKSDTKKEKKRNPTKAKSLSKQVNEAEIRSKYEDIYIYFTNFRKKRSLVYLRKEEMDNNIQVYSCNTNVIVDDLFFMIKRKYICIPYFAFQQFATNTKDARKRGTIFLRSILILKKTNMQHGRKNLSNRSYAIRD